MDIKGRESTSLELKVFILLLRQEFCFIVFYVRFISFFGVFCISLQHSRVYTVGRNCEWSTGRYYHAKIMGLIPMRENIHKYE